MSDLINLDAERAVVGAVLSQPDTIAALAGLPLAEAFWDKRYATVYRAMLSLWGKSPRVPATVVTVPDEIRAMGRSSLDEVTLFVAQLAESADPVQSMFALDHADVLLKLARLRRIKDGGARLVETVTRSTEEPDLDALFAEIRASVDALRPASSEPLTMAEQMESYRDLTLRKWRGEFVEKLAATGIMRLDRMMAGGLRAGQVMYLGARPSMGKTALLLKMASRSRSVIFSLEMPKEDLLNRLASTYAGVSFDVAADPNQMLDVTTREELRSRWVDASYEVQTWPMTIVDDVWNTAGMRRIVDQLQQEGELDAVYIDHVGIINDVVPRASLYERTSEISHRIKRMAMETKLPVIAATQLNREVEGRPGCLPYMSDIRNAGTLEEDAHVVALMYRRKYYVDKGMVTESPDQDWIHPSKGDPSWQKVSISIAKNRNGEHGTIDLGWEAKAMRYHEVAA